MLNQGDDAVLAAPKASFYAEMDRMRLPRTKFHARNADDFAAEAADADATDLRNALKEKDLPEAKRQAIAQSFAGERAKLTDLRARLQRWDPSGEQEMVDGVLIRHDPKPRPTSEGLDDTALAEAPGEFVDYLKGSMAWFNGQTNQARTYWEALLRRPAEERQYRSTWAAYMLGKSWEGEDAGKAAGYFQQVRSLKLAGFADRIGLAASSLGEEARECLRQKNFETAINLYVAQLATGDGTAVSSLRFACNDALAAGGDLTPLAADASTRRVMTAFIIAKGDFEYVFEESVETNRLRWLEAVETAGVKDVESAEGLALAAYQAGEWATAQRWIQCAPQTPTAQWLQAKLLLRGGKTRQAAVILQRIAGDFPAQTPFSTNESKPGGLENVLYMPGSTYSDEDVSIRNEIQAEAGALHLARREYTESLDALLRAGFWIDAAYVAERVLTVAELRRYVDENWRADDGTSETNANATSFNARESIRGLLGRRLARAGEFDEARAYYPAVQLTNYDAMVSSLDAANNADSSATQKAAAFTTAAWIFRTNGMELLGTEVWPDWFITGGDFTEFYNPTANRQPSNSKLITASGDEMARQVEGVDLALRFHYRYQAAGLAWQAASLMADNTDEKARLLCTAGSWIKDRDPKAADYFYKALVRHCRKTAIGALADRMRWFPTLDADGNPVPWKPAVPVETNGPPQPAGFWYVLNRGNTLEDVADAARQDHKVETTVAQLKQSNPSINVNRLKAGLTIFVPSQ